MGEQADVIHETKDSGWLGGMIYANRDDPRIIVPKKPAWLGWTINFGRPLTWGLLAVTVALWLVASRRSGS